MISASLRLQLAMVVATIVLFVGTLALNAWLFSHLEFIRGVDWIYLPAGARLLCTLLFAEAGFIGLLIGSWLVSFLYFFPEDPVRAFAGGIVSAVAPYLVYRLARWRFGLGSSLARLTSRRLLVLIVAYAIASPLLHHLLFALRGQDHLLHSFFAMFVGDLLGALILIYAFKALLAVVPRRVR